MPESVIQQPWSCVANSPDPNFYSGDLWTCSGQGCQEWLDEAHCVLKEGLPGYPATPLTQMIGDGLIYGARSVLVGVRIDFNQGSGGVTRLNRVISMPSSALNDLRDSNHPTQSFRQHLAILVHEYWHTTQGNFLGGGSIQDEVAAYNIETLAGHDLGMKWESEGNFGFPEPWRYELLKFGTPLPPDSVTSDFCSLCEAASLIHSIKGESYDTVPLMWTHDLIPVTRLACAQYGCSSQ